jgi:hypothetical protein
LLGFLIFSMGGCGDPAARELSQDSITMPFVASADQGGETEKKLDLELCSPAQGGFTLDIDNPYLPYPVGQVWVLEGEEDEEELTLQITVLDEMEEVAGVVTRVVEEREWVEGVLAEVSRNYFVETSDGTVCYFGEAVDIYDESGENVISHAGAWRADEPGNAPGIFMPAIPVSGMKFQLEVAPGIAEDEAKIVGSGPVTVPAGTFLEAIRMREFNPLDEEKDYKWYGRDVGILIDGPLELVSY